MEEGPVVGVCDGKLETTLWLEDGRMEIVEKVVGVEDEVWTDEKSWIPKSQDEVVLDDEAWTDDEKSLTPKPADEIVLDDDDKTDIDGEAEEIIDDEVRAADGATDEGIADDENPAMPKPPEEAAAGGLYWYISSLIFF